MCGHSEYMDETKAKEILEGGKTNDLKKAGSLVKDPSVVVQLLFDGDEFHMAFGSFGLAEDNLDYAVHRAKDVTLREKESFYEDNQVEADVYTLDNGSVNVKRLRATSDGWNEV